MTITLSFGAALPHRPQPAKAVVPARDRSTTATSGLSRLAPSSSDASSATMTTVPKAVSSNPRTPSVRPWWRSASRTQLGGVSLIDTRPSQGSRPSTCRQGSDWRLATTGTAVTSGNYGSAPGKYRGPGEWCTVTVWSLMRHPAPRRRASRPRVRDADLRPVLEVHQPAARRGGQARSKRCSAGSARSSESISRRSGSGQRRPEVPSRSPTSTAPAEDLLPPDARHELEEYFPWLQREMLAGRIVAALLAR